MINKYPTTDFHELNLDWIIHEIRKLHDEIDDFIAVNKIEFKGMHDITKSYPSWSVVSDSDNNAYMSLKPVPAGVSLDNTDYWVLVANYTALFAEVQTMLAELKDTHIYTFETVADMLAADLESGDIAQTLGYYAKDDGGSAKYIITETSSRYTETLENGLLAELVNKCECNVKQYGAVGNGVADDAAAFRNAFTNTVKGGRIHVPNAVYKLDTRIVTSEKAIVWDCEVGTRFTGAGASVDDSGKFYGSFPYCYTNKFVIDSGEYELLSPEEVQNRSVINCKTIEMYNPAFVGGSARRWVNLLYIGADTGTLGTHVPGTAFEQQVELANLVLEVTDQKGIGVELDYNMRSDKVAQGEFGAAIFITGGSTHQMQASAIDIQMGTLPGAVDDDIKWSNGISLRNCKVGMFIADNSCDRPFIIGHGSDIVAEITNAGKLIINDIQLNKFPTAGAITCDYYFDIYDKAGGHFRLPVQYAPA